MTRRALLLAGSPRTASTSQVMGERLLGELKRVGWETESFGIYAALASDESWQALSTAATEADLLILSAPLYVDSFSAGVIRALERLAGERKNRADNSIQRMIAIVNSGFPEPVQSQIAIGIARRFAKETDLQWAGGIIIASGGAINGRPLEEFGKMVHHIELGLTIAAQAIEKGELIPEEVMDLSINYPLPKGFFVLVVNLLWWFQARAHGTQKRLRDRPYHSIDHENEVCHE